MYQIKLKAFSCLFSADLQQITDISNINNRYIRSNIVSTFSGVYIMSSVFIKVLYLKTFGCIPNNFKNINKYNV